MSETKHTPGPWQVSGVRIRTPEPDWAERKARQVAHSLPPSDFGSHRAIMAFAAALREAVKAEREACAKLAATFAPTEPSPIGPLHGAGMSTAAIHIANAIRERPL